MIYDEESDYDLDLISRSQNRGNVSSQYVCLRGIVLSKGFGFLGAPVCINDMVPAAIQAYWLQAVQRIILCCHRAHGLPSPLILAAAVWLGYCHVGSRNHTKVAITFISEWLPAFIHV